MKIIKPIIFLIITMTTFLYLVGCSTDDNTNYTDYYNNSYFFTISIPNDIYEYLTNQKRTSNNVEYIDFIFSKINNDESICEGVLFTIAIYSKAVVNTISLRGTEDYYCMGDTEDYYFYFIMRTGPIESMCFETYFNDNKDRILQIAYTFNK